MGDASKINTVDQIMEALGVSRQEATFIHAIESGAISGDVIDLDKPKAAPWPDDGEQL